MDQAVEEWEKAQVLFVSPAWERQPVARHMADILKDRPDLESQLIKLLNHKNQLVAAYSLLTLNMMESPAVGDLPAELLRRAGKLTQRTGSFSEKLELGAFARRTQKEWHLRKKGVSSSESSPESSEPKNRSLDENHETGR